MGGASAVGGVAGGVPAGGAAAGEEWAVEGGRSRRGMGRGKMGGGDKSGFEPWFKTWTEGLSDWDTVRQWGKGGLTSAVGLPS